VIADSVDVMSSIRDVPGISLLTLAALHWDASGGPRVHLLFAPQAVAQAK
jgi:hypothetical protein